uniref:Uncharacterized protein n=1 Tax=Paulinella chromatophora TaxID=39717 RepID=B1X4P4_PAUCH|nr:hypothetical protein PCC_0475 [Paulinella chromatophora]ACB42913.1 hypothetical protein PCC_0475 [Paulinella chromatophora]
MVNHKIVIIDDDPTGSQTVNDCPLLLRWDQSILRVNLRGNYQFLFILANTRGMIASEAADTILKICQSIKQALLSESIKDWLLISRGDSTLRGHFPLEIDSINTELGPFQATFFVPSFLEGKRRTVNGVHLLNSLPVHKTPFACDHLFDFDTSFLPNFIEKKSHCRLIASNIVQINVKLLNRAISNDVVLNILKYQLMSLTNNAFVTVDAESYEQLRVFSLLIKKVCFPEYWNGIRKNFLFQTAAGFIASLVDFRFQQILPIYLSKLRRKSYTGKILPGLIVVGSYIPLADAQLDALLADPGCVGVELPIAKLINLIKQPLPTEIVIRLERQWFQELQEILVMERTPVLFTSRGELTFDSSEERLQFGYNLAQLMARLVSALAPQLGYLISKGGITSHILLAEGLNLGWVYLDGQILPGLSMVRQLEDVWVSQCFKGLPILTFPGNLGDNGTLKEAWYLMEKEC